jgi:hypothetical protein
MTPPPTLWQPVINESMAKDAPISQLLEEKSINACCVEVMINSIFVE